MLQRIETVLDSVATFPRRSPYAWPVAMVVIGGLATLAALVMHPGPDEWTYFFHTRFGGPCGFQETTGLPCPSCGMTRSWVWLARGHVIKAFTYNAAGASLLIGLWVMGFLGAVRLITRDPRRWEVPFRLLSTAVMLWMLFPYLSLWIARLFGFNPLP